LSIEWCADKKGDSKKGDSTMGKLKPPHAQMKTHNFGTVEVSELPTLCPRCHTAAIPEILGGIAHAVDPDSWMFPTLDVPVRCSVCQLAYIAEYDGTPYHNGPDVNDIEVVFTFTRTVPNALPLSITSPTIQAISPRFSQVFDQAAAAESDGLDEVAGAGYRRAFEILVKDYLIGKDPANRERYIKTWLGVCIKEHITDPTIQDLAKRANETANDFVHYKRYSGRDLKDLVSLIDLTRAWIELQAKTEAVRMELDSPPQA
jgi:hypothetical protein